ncbi:MAG: hypothetical protein ACOYMG_12590 [Candidatus Methylumidiphilus sp.]
MNAALRRLVRACALQRDWRCSSNSHYGSIAIIPAWMPESSAMDGDMLVA